MAVQAPLTEELARFKNPDYRFLALLGYDSDLDVALLNIKNSIRHVSLLEDVLIFLKFQDRFACPYLGEKGFGIEPVTGELPHGNPLCTDKPAPSIVAIFNAETK